MLCGYNLVLRRTGICLSRRLRQELARSSFASFYIHCALALTRLDVLATLHSSGWRKIRGVM